MRFAALACALCAALVAGAARGAQGPPSGAVQGRVLVNALSVVLEVPTDPVKAGRDFRIRAHVTNAGSVAVENVRVSLVSPPGLRLSDPRTQTLPRIGPGAERTVRWGACSRIVGNYIVIARATEGLFTVESAGQVVQIVSANNPSC